MSYKNFNDKVLKENLGTWHCTKIVGWQEPPTNTNIVLFAESGNIFCGYYKKRSKSFVVYGIGAKELEDVEITHWMILPFPDEFQEKLDKAQ